MTKQISLLMLTAAFLAGCNKKDKVEEVSKAGDTKVTEQTVFSKEQVAAIEQIAHKYIVNNPNVIAESIMNLQKQALDKQQEKILELIKQNKTEIDRTAGLPFVGSISSDVTILMFGDYTDPKSRAMFKMYQNIVQKDKKIRVVFRFLPDTSALAQKMARVAMALNDQGLFEKFHEKMLALTEPLTETSLMDTAANVPGVNRTKLDADVDAGKTKEALLSNRTLADKLGITQAPGYLIGDFLLKQLISADDLELVITKIREPKK